MMHQLLKWLGMLAMGTCILIGAWMMVDGAGQVRQASRSVRWTPVPATITASGSTHATKGQRNFFVRYRYVVGDRTFESPTVRPGVGISASQGSFANRMVQRYPVGREVIAYHDPEHPGMAVLETGLNRNSFANLVAGWLYLLVGTGLAGLFFLPEGMRPRAATWSFGGLMALGFGLFLWVTP